MDRVLNGSRDEVIECLQDKRALLGNNVLGQSAIHLAIATPTILSLLLEAGANVDVQDRCKRNPLEYAAIYGYTESVMLLLKAGAYPLCHDEKYSQHIVFLNHAQKWGHWDLITRAFSFFTASPYYSDEFLKDELNYLITNHANSGYNLKAKGLECLLKLGANPNLILDRDPKLGSNANHQNLQGHSALHILTFKMQQQFFSHLSERPDEITKAIVEAATLLHKGADPIIHDNCRCPCSRNGCSASTVLSVSGNSNLQEDVWSLEWLLMLREYKDADTIQEALLDLVQAKQFERLGITHICCRKAQSSFHPELPIDYNKVDEILDEEKDSIQILGEFIKDISASLDTTPEEAWLDFLSQHSVPEGDQHEIEWGWGIWQVNSMSYYIHPSPPPNHQPFQQLDQRDLAVPTTNQPAGFRCYIHKPTDTFIEE